MSSVNGERQSRALEAALAHVGDRWSLLVVNALLDGPLRFNELQEALDGIATNVLSQRLKALESRGMVVASPYSERPQRFVYALTSVGHDLAGAVRLLAQWGADRSGDPAEAPTHADCGTALEVRWYCPTCTRVLGEAEDVDPGFI
jgi:DNA-binding HxlR family transcriptional regulator